MQTVQITIQNRPEDEHIAFAIHIDGKIVSTTDLYMLNEETYRTVHTMLYGVVEFIYQMGVKRKTQIDKFINSVERGEQLL